MWNLTPRYELEQLPVIRFRRCWRSVIPWIGALIAAAGLALWLTVAFPGSVHFIRLSADFALPLPIFFLCWLVLAVRPAMLMLDARYEISHHHLRAVTGILSVYRYEVEIAYEDLLTVEVQQTILDRILCVGQVIAGSAMSDIPRIIIKGIATPAFYASQIEHRVDLTRKMDREQHWGFPMIEAKSGRNTQPFV